MDIVLKHNKVSEDADIVMCMEETHAPLHRLKEWYLTLLSFSYIKEP